MIDHRLTQLALRTQLLTFAGPTTGSTTLSATSTGYARSTGSFLTDGFAAGMEVTPTGFTQTALGVVEGVTATTLTIKGGRTAQSSGAGRTIAVSLPSVRAWENIDLTPTALEPYVAEEYLPGAMTKATLGAFGELEATPLYVVRYHAPQRTGFSALARYADTTLTLFAPGTPMTVGSDTLRVRSDVAPTRGQLTPLENGWAFVSVTIPCRIRTANSR